MTRSDAQGVTRVFLGRDRPALDAACRWLIEQFADGATLDLERVAIVTPGARAGRLLLGSLVDACEGAGLALVPPETLTPGSLAERLLEPPELPHAGNITRTLAWAEALRSVGVETLAPLVPSPPADDDDAGWRRLGGVLADASRELASVGLTIADAAERVEAEGLDPSPERWLAAAAAQRVYADLLRSRGLSDPDLSRIGRRVWSEHGIEAIVLLSVADLSPIGERAVRSAAAVVWSLVQADGADADAFDDLGRPVAEVWAERPSPLTGEQVVFAEGPEDQAEQALASIALLDPAPSAADIVIGAPDAEVIDALRLASAEVGGLRVHDARGVPIERTPPALLLDAVRTHLRQRSIFSAADLVRHPEVECWLSRSLGSGRTRAEWWLRALDDFLSASPQPEGDEASERAAEQTEIIGKLLGALGTLLSPLDPPGSASPGRRAAGEWAERILEVLQTLYAGHEGRASRLKERDMEALRRIAAACADLAAASQHGADLPMDACDALDLVLEELAGASLAEESSADAIELVGWLELALDPSPVLVLTGMNEGLVPPSRRPHPLLGEQVRTRLGLPGREARIGLDAFRLHAAVAGRRSVVAIAGRRNLAGDPLSPSRLLLLADDDATADRVLRWTEQRDPQSVRVARRAPAPSGPFDAPKVEAPPAIDRVSVTAFRDYLQSPYLFYLRHVLRLRDVGDEELLELDGAGFGSLLHEVLEDFGKSDQRDETDPDRIERALHAFLEPRAEQLCGTTPPPAVRVQSDLARRRLSDFALAQAQRRAEGWRIEHCELYINDADLVVHGRRIIGLRGRIDRIDRHERTGRHAIIDYKTGNTVKEPGSAHRTRSGWEDLQLPLYRHLAAKLLGSMDVDLGYARIPSKREDVGFAFVPWDADALAEADAVASEVARGILEGRFFEGDLPVGKGAEGYILDLGVARVLGAVGYEGDGQ